MSFLIQTVLGTFSFLVAHPILAPVLLVLLFVGFLVAFAGDHATDLLLGPNRVTPAPFYKPILFSQKAMGTVGWLWRRKEGNEVASDQHLLNRALAVMHATVALPSFVGLAGGQAGSRRAGRGKAEAWRVR